MPVFEFVCDKCGAHFEELVAANVNTAICPDCGQHSCPKIVSIPSPLKKGAFPYKPGRVQPLGAFNRGPSPCASCASGSACASGKD